MATLGGAVMRKCAAAPMKKSSALVANFGYSEQKTLSLSSLTTSSSTTIRSRAAMAPPQSSMIKNEERSKKMKS